MLQDAVLYGHPDSGHACKAAFALALAGVPHRRVRVDIWAPPETRPAARPADRPKDATPAPAAAGGRNLLQIGIFSVEANATRAAEQVKKAGAEARVRKEESQGKTFWRVLAGPAASAADRDALLAKVKQLGYADAYFVTR